MLERFYLGVLPWPHILKVRLCIATAGTLTIAMIQVSNVELHLRIACSDLYFGDLHASQLERADCVHELITYEDMRRSIAITEDIDVIRDRVVFDDSAFARPVIGTRSHGMLCRFIDCWTDEGLSLTTPEGVEGAACVIV